MTESDKIRLANIVVEFLSSIKQSNDTPIMVGTLIKRQGIKGFKVADVGHPVFEFKDRYIIYVQSETELTEKVYDPKRQQFNTSVGFFTVAIPYYKETLAHVIDFIKPTKELKRS